MWPYCHFKTLLVMENKQAFDILHHYKAWFKAVLKNLVATGLDSYQRGKKPFLCPLRPQRCPDHWKGKSSDWTAHSHMMHKERKVQEGWEEVPGGNPTIATPTRELTPVTSSWADPLSKALPFTTEQRQQRFWWDKNGISEVDLEEQSLPSPLDRGVVANN